MISQYNLSPPLRDLLAYTERELGIDIILHRQTDVPPQGLLIDDFTYDTGKNVIAFSSSQLGLLKDFVITQNCYRLLFRGMAHRAGKYRLLSFNEEGATTGMQQVYLDTLKDENTRNMELWRKRQLLFYLYMMFHESLSDLPWSILANIVIAKKYPVMRNAQVYYLIKESMRDMHDLVPVKDYLPQRYFVMHNGMYYARDMILAYVLSEFKLNPVINIPELQKFRNLDVKEMMTHRWSRSIWYHTKMVGDAMSNILKLTINIDFERQHDEQYYLDIFECGVDIINRWMAMMAMQDWYIWGTSEHLREANKRKETIEKTAQKDVIGE